MERSQALASLKSKHLELEPACESHHVLGIYLLLDARQLFYIHPVYRLERRIGKGIIPVER